MSLPWEIRTGDALELLSAIADDSVQTVVTSPPYWGLRDYGVAGQLGLEANPAEYVEALVAVLDAVRRVLCPDGTLWLNLGDSYAGSWGAQSRTGLMASRSIVSARQIENHPQFGSRTGTRGIGNGVKPKDLFGLPWMVAFALRDAGWWLRSDIVWAKQNCMPESIRDRPTRSHEFIFLMSKSARYYYDVEATKEPAVSAAPSGNGFARPEQITRDGRGQNEKWNDVGGSRRLRTVWHLPTQPNPLAHFATFPPRLVEPCILAGSRPGDLVLDPFSGTATTGVVALKLGRRFLGLELNPEYAEMGRQRIRDDAPLLNTPAEEAS